MKNKIFVLGIGGSGSRVANLYQKNNINDDRIVSLAMDTDLAELENLDSINKISLTNIETMVKVTERLEKEKIEKWFPIDEDGINIQNFKILDMHKGARQWRNNGLLAFVDYLENQEKKSYFNSIIDSIFDDDSKDITYDFYLLSSICGGTGSALILPVSIYITNYIKEKYNKKIKFNFLLTCPDIYTEKLSGELKTKCYANAYAILQELNSYNLVANGYNKKALKNNKSIINLKLYLGSDIIFDSLDSKYQSTNILPYNHIYLFDKILCMNGISNHENVLAELLKFIVNHNEINKNENSEKPFTSVYMTKISYQYDNNIEYILNKKTIDDISNQWLYFYDYVNHQLKLNALKEDENFSKKNETDFDKTLRFLDILKSIEEVDNLDEAILNRNFSDNNVDALIQYSESIESIIAMEIEDEIMKDSLDRDETIDVSKIIKLIDQPFEIEKIKAFEDKGIKKAKKDKIIKRAKYLNKCLEDFYMEMIKDFYEGKNELFNEFFIPIIKKYLSDSEGKMIHPMIALLRLIRLYKGLLLRINDIEIIPENEFNLGEYEQKIPKELYTILGSKKVANSKYLNSGVNRFWKLCGLETIKNDSLEDLDNHNTNEKYKLLNNLHIDYSCIQDDAHSIIENVTKHITMYYINAYCDMISKMINQYMEMFKSLKKIIPFYEEALSNIKVENTYFSPVSVNVGNSKTEKEMYYEEFCKTKDNFNFDDSLAGELVYNCVLCSINDKEKEINNDVAKFVFEQTYNNNKQLLKDNIIISTLRTSNIIQMLEKDNIMDSNKNIKNIKNKISRVINGVPSPLNIKGIDMNNSDSPVIQDHIYFSNSLTNYIFEIKDDYDIVLEEENKVVNDFLYKIGSTKHDLVVSNVLNEYEFCVTNKISQMPLYWFNKADELDSHNPYYYFFKSIMEEKKIESSELWNPYIFKSKNQYNLICLNPAMQELQEEKFAKAILWMLLSGKATIELEDFEDEKSRYIYYVSTGKGNLPVVYNEECVLMNEVDKLFSFVKSNRTLVDEWSIEFDKYSSSLYGNLNIGKGNSRYFSIVERNIIESKLVKLLTENYFDYVTSSKKYKKACLIQILFEATNNEINRDSVLIIKEVSKLLRKQIDKYLYDTELDTESVFKEVSKEVIASVNNYITDIDKLSEIAKWIKKVF